MLGDRENLCPLMKMFDRRRHMGASDEAKRLILDHLEVIYGSQRVVWRDNRGGVVKKKGVLSP